MLGSTYVVVYLALRCEKRDPRWAPATPTIFLRVTCRLSVAILKCSRPAFLFAPSFGGLVVGKGMRVIIISFARK